MACELCKRNGQDMTKHHLIPKSKSRGKCVEKAMLCVPCHKMVHATFTTKQLKKFYSTIQKLRDHPKIIVWVKWVKEKNPRDINHHGKN